MTVTDRLHSVKCAHCGRAIRWARKFGWVHRVDGAGRHDDGSRAEPMEVAAGGG